MYVYIAKSPCCTAKIAQRVNKLLDVDGARFGDAKEYRRATLTFSFIIFTFFGKENAF